jgi:transcriptional regulator of met regulon
MKKKDLENLRMKTKEELSTLAASLWVEIMKVQIDKRTSGKVKNMNEAKNKMKDSKYICVMFPYPSGDGLQLSELTFCFHIIS